MIIECIDNQEADAIQEKLVARDVEADTQLTGQYILVCECGCNRLFRRHTSDFAEIGDFPDDAGYHVVTTDELRERIAAENTGEPESGERPGAMYSLSEMQPDEVLREPTDGDVRVSQGNMWDVRTVTPEWATELWPPLGPRTARHEQTRRLQQEYQRILDEAAERHRSNTEWVIVDDTRGT